MSELIRKDAGSEPFNPFKPLLIVTQNKRMAFDKLWLKAKTLGELKSMEYRPKSVKEELRENLIEALRKKEPVFEGILGYEDTVLPDVERAVLAKNNILPLGLHG